MNTLLMFSLETDRLLLRDFVETDVPLVWAMAQESSVTRYQSLLRLATPQDAERWVRDCIFYNNERPRNAYNLAVVERARGAALGWLGWGRASDPTKADYGFGYALLPRFQGQGYMTEAHRAALDFIFTQTGAERVSDYCETENLASARVMQKAGLSFTEQWEDEEQGVRRTYARYTIHRSEWWAQQVCPDRNPG